MTITKYRLLFIKAIIYIKLASLNYKDLSIKHMEYKKGLDTNN